MKNSTKEIINEINTLPGFTNISMYPKLWETSGKEYSKLLDELKNKNPLTHCITNFVTVNDCANAVLAIGASPIMSEDIEEVAEDIYTQ